MSEQIKDGGQAFPVAGFEGESMFFNPTSGMTLRDYFAAKEVIAEGEMTSAFAKALMGSEIPVSDGSMEKVIALYTWWAQAESRYKFLRADAMLSARDGTT